MTNPYKRIIRPLHQDHYGFEHLLDDRYCTERYNLVHAYHIIQNDFIKLIDYIELHDNNSSVFSHRTFELLLRTCTEFENNCKGILEDNNYVGTGHLNIKDYFKINNASRLNEFELRINVWSPNPKIIKPFQEWHDGDFHPLTWYQNYNSVKHNRSQDFDKASLETLVLALGGLFVILASQFYTQIFHQFQANIGTYVGDDKYVSTENNIFSIKFPQSWTPADYTTFDWNTIKSSTDPFQTYNF